MKKTLSVFLAALLLLSTISCISTTAFAADYPTLGVGEHIVQTYEYFYFAPEMDGYYRIKSINNDGCSPSIELINTEDESDYYDSFDEDNIGCEFDLVVHFFADTYYICRVQDLFSMDSGEDINISIEYLGEDYEDDDDDIVGGDYPTIGEGEHILSSGSYFYFIPDESGYYKFESNGNGDPKITITCNGDEYQFDDERGYDFFGIVELVAGEEILCYLYNYDDVDSVFTISKTKDVESIEFNLVEPIEIMENTNGEWDFYEIWDDEFEDWVIEEYYHYHTPTDLWSEGNSITVNYKDGTSDVYTYDYYDEAFVNTDGDILDWDYEIDQSYYDQWTVGSDNYITVTCYGKEALVPVTIIENPCESIEFNLVEPIEIIEYTNGYWAEDEIWDDELEDSVIVEYYHYYTPDGLRNEGNSITVNYKDGTSDVYTYEYYDEAFVNADGDILDWDYEIDQSYRNQWTIGSDNYITVTCYGKETLVPVTIIESTVESIEFNLVKPIEIIENTNGYWVEVEIWDDEIEDWVWVEYYRYTPDLRNLGNSITVNYKDGTSDIYYYNGNIDPFVNADGDWLYWDYETNQSYYNQWTIGSDNYITITSLGKETQVPVTIIENPCESIEFNLVEPIEIMENTNGEWYEDIIWDDDGFEEWVAYYHYHTPTDLWSEGNSIIVNFKNGTSDVYTYDYDYDGFVNADGDFLDWDYETNQSYENKWTIGSDNYITITCLGKETLVPVTIIENSCESIEFNLVKPIEIMENTNGEWDFYEIWDDELEDWVIEEYYYYYRLNGLRNEGNSITVNYNDGTSDVYTYDYDYDGFVNADGDFLDWDYKTDQSYYNQWTLGSDNYITVTCYNKETLVPVTIIENPCESIEFNLVEPLVIQENTQGCWVEDEIWDDELEEWVWVEYYYYTPDGLFYEGNNITVNYKDGTSDVYTYDYYDEAFVNADGDFLDWDYATNQSYYDQWTIGSDNYITIICEEFYKTTEIPVTIIEEGDLHEHTASDWIIDENATCTEEGSKHKECTECGETLETEAIPSNGHTTVKDAAIAATCTAPGKTEGSHCSVCNTVIVAQTVIPAKGHTTVKDVAVAATCTTPGKTEGSHCSVCNTVIVAQTVIPAKGHTTVKNAAVAATCTTPGKTEGSHCSVCNTVIVAQTVVPAKGHTTVKDAAVAATCTAPGKTEGSHCSVCNTVIVAQTVIPAKGHTTVKDAAVAATCTTPGKTEGSHCSVCNTVIVAQTVIPAKGHTLSDWIIDSNATVSAPGSKHKECTECGETLETAVITQLKPATPKVATTNEINGVNITWNAVEGAVKYNVYRRQGGQSAWTLVGTTTATSLTDTKVSSGIYYVYSVRAYNNAGQYSDFVNANTQTRKFMAVPKLTGISNATNGLYIKWNAVAGVTNGYRVYRRGAGSTYWTYLGTVKTTYYTDTQVKAKSGEYYRYTVIADGGYHSKFDTAGLYLRRLANPTLNSAVSSKNGITVKWSAVQGTTGYYVYRKTANSGWVRIAAVGGTNNTTYLDKTAKKGVTYTYTVRAVCGTNTSYFNSGISCKDKY